MRLRAALLAGLAAGLVPCGMLSVLVAAGKLAAGPALLAELAIVAAFAGIALVWSADLARLPDLLEPGLAPPPALWPHREVGAEITRRLHQRRAGETQLRLASEAERAIVDLLPDPLLILSADRVVQRSNRAARDMLGADIPAILRHPTLRGAIDRAHAPTGPVQTIELLIPAPVPRDLHATVINLGEDADGRARTALVLSDRTRDRAVERMRADFVANASHELRTPLASLIGFIDTLRGPAQDDLPAQQRFLAIMAEQAARMNRLIDDLLSLSRIELTEHMAPSSRVNLADIVLRALRGFEPRREQGDVSLVETIAPGLPPVFADADQIEQVLQNLLDNALKYGRAGGTIHLDLQPASGGAWPSRPGMVLSVRDEGIGIPREHLPRLTERFYRVDRGRSRAAGGTGLGLAIVKHIVTRHRGQLTIDSEENNGTTVSVWLPAAAV